MYTVSKIPCIFWNQKVHSHFYKSRPPVLILSHMNSVHTLPSYFCKVSFNIVFPSIPSSCRWSLSLGFPCRNLLCIFLHHCACCMWYSSHPSWFCHPNNMSWGVKKIAKHLIFLFLSASCYFSLLLSVFQISFLFLKCVLFAHLTYFCLSLLLCFRYRNYCHLACFFWCKYFEHFFNYSWFMLCPFRIMYICLSWDFVLLCNIFLSPVNVPAIK